MARGIKVTDELRASRVAQWLKKKKKPACQCRRLKTQVLSLGWKDPLEWEMTTHSNILAWKISWTKEPGGLLWSMGHQELDTMEGKCMHGIKAADKRPPKLGDYPRFSRWAQ